MDTATSPLKGDGQTPLTERGFARYTMYFKEFGIKIQNKIIVSPTSSSRPINICKLL